MVEITQADRERSSERFSTRELAILTYRSLLDLPRFPELPSIMELPDSFFLPREFLGNIREAIYQSQASEREFSQRIDWVGKLEVRKLLKGRKSSTAAEFYHGDSGLFHYHTHDLGLGFSERDVVLALARPLGSMEGAVRLFGGSEFGVDVLLVTKESEKWRGNFIRTLKNRIVIERDLKRNDFCFLDDTLQAEILNSYGLGYYRALGEDRGGIQIVSTEILSQDDGLQLARV